ncbi:MAG TPA: hypothetical protein VKY22_02760 [Bradyrhizobium sp.]|nr:hypothetical protein [Bradyrhizobium sp.]
MAKANIEHYLRLLETHDLSAHNRSTITKLLIAEEDKLSHDLEHLEFAESRASSGRERVDHVRKLRDSFAFGTAERDQADRVLVNLENRQTLLQDFCQQLREKITSRDI